MNAMNDMIRDMTVRPPRCGVCDRDVDFISRRFDLQAESFIIRITCHGDSLEQSFPLDQLEDGVKLLGFATVFQPPASLVSP
jgi:hypothetical protein